MLTVPLCALGMSLAPARPPGLPVGGLSPPPDGRGVYGDPMDEHVDSAHFTVAWNEGAATREDAVLTAASLEDAWDRFVEDDGWLAPVSSDAWLLWVVLDPDLDATGFTTLETSADYPQGYPVIYLNPTYTFDQDFFQSLAAHEFMHALQYRVRDENSAVGTIDEETWYWEASAEWAAQQLYPDLDVVALQAPGYLDHPERRYTDLDDGHAYGMFLLNAWIEESAGGELGEIWTLGSARPAATWDEILAESLDLDVPELWGGFTSAVAHGQLERSGDYGRPTRDTRLPSGASGELPYLGTDYYVLDAPVARVRATGSVLLSSREGSVVAGPDAVLELDGGDVLAVTGLGSEDSAYVLDVDRAYRASVNDRRAPACAAVPGGSWVGGALAPLVCLGRCLRRRRCRDGNGGGARRAG